MPVAMEFGLLGPLLVRRGETVVPVRRGHQRTVLATLLLEANRMVLTETITETLWGAVPPLSAPVAIRSYIMRLRQVLGEAGPRRIRTEPRGYLLRVDDGELDSARFEHLLAAARAAGRDGSWDTAAAQAQQALALWRGEPLADIESEALVQREAPRLAELRLQAVETRIEAGLHLGGHAEVAAELPRLAATHPLREHLHALLMLALYRSGRQADALAAYQHARTMLAEELGAEPGTELQEVHQRILAADPTLIAPPPPGAAGVTGPSAANGLAPGAPRQLPATVTDFTGRTAELAALAGMLDRGSEETPGTVVISAIGGTAGVGKTALAVYWAHQVAQRFDDGQLYANLRGFGPAGVPATPAEAIRGFLDALGVAPERIPADPDAQAGLYRSLLAGKRMLIVLDNAHDEQQVRPLLPASPGALVIVTSRSQLAGLAATDGARLLTLDVLTAAEAIQMLTARIGARRAAAEPQALGDIADLCAHLPLALAVAAARAHAQPRLPLAALAAELRETATRLDALDTGDPATSVRAVFSWSYRQLSPGAAGTFRLLGIHPGPDITAPAAASLAGIPPAQARHLLAELTRAHLLTEHRPGRYTLHDLLRAYAAEEASSLPEADRQDATGRTLDHYLHTAHTAALLLNPAWEPITLAPARPGVTPEQPGLSGFRPSRQGVASGTAGEWASLSHRRRQFHGSPDTLEQPADAELAMAWFEAEHPVLMRVVMTAVQAGFDACVWQLAWAMNNFLDWRGHWHECAAIQRAALAAATRLDDTAGQATAGKLLGHTCARIGDYDEARDHLTDCLELYRKLGDRVGEGQVHQNLGWVAERQNRYADALRHEEQALTLYRTRGDQAGQARALNNVGWCHALLGDYQQAQSFCQQALVLYRDTGDRNGEAFIWDSLGYAAHKLGHTAQAAECYQHALSINREFGDRYAEAGTLTRLGDAHHAAAGLREARDAWRQALDILDDLRHPDADQVRAKLASMGDQNPENPPRQG
jgi:DNA-binding SARP family transcriptional activator